MPEYLEELSQYALENEKAAVLAYPYLDHYWREPDRLPFIFYDVKHDDSGDISANHHCFDCGFALVRRLTSGDSAPDFHTIAEFYIKPNFRNRGLGKNAVREILNFIPGTWLIQVMERNEPAMIFWQKTLLELTKGSPNTTLHNGFYDLTFTI